jgi:hypothetical protein
MAILSLTWRWSVYLHRCKLELLAEEFQVDMEIEMLKMAWSHGYIQGTQQTRLPWLASQTQMRSQRASFLSIRQKVPMLSMHKVIPILSFSSVVACPEALEYFQRTVDIRDM